MKTQIINREDVQTLLSLIPNGSFFTAVFTKKPEKGQLVGEERVMNCRRGVTKHLNPTAKKREFSMPKHLVTVFDVKVGDYRMFNLNTLRTIRAMGQEFQIA